MEIKVIIVDDHKIMREGLRFLLKDKPNIKVIGEAENGRQALSLVDKLKPDIVIMDVAMPDLNGIEATRMIVKDHPNTRVIALSSHSGKEFVTGMFQAGTSGYLLKDCAFDELYDAIQSVYAKHTYLSREITDLLVRDYVSNVNAVLKEEPDEQLSTREKEVLQLIAEGHSTKEIAGQLFVSVKTIESHRSNIMRKLNMFTIPELTKYAIRSGLTTLET